jgi:hypothetical protein
LVEAYAEREKGRKRRYLQNWSRFCRYVIEFYDRISEVEGITS